MFYRKLHHWRFTVQNFQMFCVKFYTSELHFTVGVTETHNVLGMKTFICEIFTNNESDKL